MQTAIERLTDEVDRAPPRAAQSPEPDIPARESSHSRSSNGSPPSTRDRAKSMALARRCGEPVDNWLPCPIRGSRPRAPDRLLPCRGDQPRR
jgi:hypothetical protein